MDSFDPYLNWLDIPRDQRPVNHYRLFGLAVGESNAGRITAAADQSIAHVQNYASGEQAAIAERLLAEMVAAKACLLDPQARGRYDAGLQSHKPSGETAIKSPPPLPGRSQVAGGSGPERQIQSAPPPPGSAGARTSASGPQQTIQSPPPAPGGTPTHAARPTITGAPPPPGAPSGQVPGSAPGLPTTPPAPHVPTGPETAGSPPVAPPPGPASTGGTVAPPTPTPPIAAPPTMPTAPVAQPVPVAAPVATPTAATPEWAPADRSGSVGTATAKNEPTELPRAPSRTREARSFRRKVRREKKFQFYSIVFGVAAILFGLIVLLILVAVS